MQLTVDFWQLVGMAITVAGAFAAVMQRLLAQSQREILERLKAIEDAAKEDKQQWQRVERELMTMKADLPLHYVRREDYVQSMATIMTKLDSMTLRIENILLKGASREH